jgi:Domain of unknown function (DUF5615)
LRLLLDEMYSPHIASQLRDRGHDVVSVTERSDLTGLRDAEVVARAAQEGRTIVTNDVGHFVPLFHEVLAASRDHPGLLLTSDRSLPRNRAGIGRYVEVLDVLLAAHPDEDALRNQLRWLP